MRKGIILCALVLAAGLSVFGSGSTPGPKRFARFVIPVQQQPEFSGMTTNFSTNAIFEVSGWTTNVVSFETVSNGVVSVTNSMPLFAEFDLITTNNALIINTNTFAYCDFEIFAFDEGTNNTIPIYYLSSLGGEDIGLIREDWNK